MLMSAGDRDGSIRKTEIMTRQQKIHGQSDVRFPALLCAASLLTLCIGLSAVQAQESAAEPERGPNFVLIMADDMGYGDAGCYGGSAFPTPALDRLAAEGMRFTDFHSSGCVCSPTRAGLLTGRYQQRSGVDGVIYSSFNRNRHHGLQLKEVTFAERLRAAGYATAVFGKWHLGYEEQYNPVHQGFDRFVGYVSGNVDFHSHIDGVGIFDWWHQNHHQREPGYTTHLITQHACDYVKQCAADEKPFCIYVAHEAPHDPYQGPHDAAVRREGQSKLLWNHRRPKHAARAYREMMKELDSGVGQILDTLAESEVDGETLVMFFSDNGATGPGSCGELYGMKSSLWEGGHRVPGIARWPGHIPAGAVTDQLACTIDVMPTLLDLIGAEAAQKPPMDGVSLADVLLHQRALPERQIFWQHGDAVCMRDGNMKLIINGGRRSRRDPKLIPNIDWDRPQDGREQLALFDLSIDPAEQHNLVDEQPGRVSRMQRAIRDWQTDVGAGATQQPERPNRSSDRQATEKGQQ